MARISEEGFWRRWEHWTEFRLRGLFLNCCAVLLVGIALTSGISGAFAADSDLAGKRVLVIGDDADLRVEANVVGKVAPGRVLVVEQVNGEWLWIPAEQGWLPRESVIPLDTAVAELTSRIDTNPTPGAFSLRGLARHAHRDYEKAVADFTRSLEMDSRQAATYTNRANSLQALGQIDAAIADYTRAIELDPKSAPARNNRSIALARKGDYVRALDDASAAIGLDPKYAEAYNNRGVTRRHKEDFAKAIEDYTEAIRLQPSYAAAYGNRGYALKRLGNYEDALRDYTQALELDRDLWSAHNDLAWLLATCPVDELRNGAKAVEHATRAVELTKGDDWNALDTRAAAHAEAGEFDKAVEWAEKAIAKAPATANEQLVARLNLYKEQKPYHEAAK